jgi:hypothetical protein
MCKEGGFMNLIDCDVRVSHWTRWEDPGDYPSNAGGAPLPSGPWEPECAEGCAVYKLEDGDMAELEEAKREGYLRDYFDEVVLDIGGEYDTEYLYPDSYEYEEVQGFLVVVPDFDRIDGPCMAEELKKTKEWLVRTGQIKEEVSCGA